MIKPSKLAHVVLNSYRAEELTEWYCTVLGATVNYCNGPVTFLSYDEEHHRMGIAQMPGEPVEKDILQPGLQHIAFTYDSIKSMLLHYEELRDRGIKPKVMTNHGPTVSFYYRDPDGNIVEMMVDRFATMDEALDFMRGEIFGRNPVGFEVDPDKMLADLRAGVPEEEILAYHDIETDPWSLAVKQRAALGSPTVKRPDQ